jgi:transposase
LAPPLAGRRHRRAAQQGPQRPAATAVRQQLAEVEQALLKGASANGFTGELWTVDRVALVIERLTGVRHHPAHVWALPRHRLGWSPQRPMRRAAERDEQPSPVGSRRTGRGSSRL